MSKKMISILMSVVLVVGLCPMPAYAGEGNTELVAGTVNLQSSSKSGEVIASGTWGTCPWEISAEGVLTIGAGTGESSESSSLPWSEYRNDIKSVTTSGTVVLPADCSHMFSGCSNLVTADLSGFDTSNVTNMYSMFHGCSMLKTLNLTGWDTSRVTDMGYMFWLCSSLEMLDITGFDTSNVTNMNGMFAYCKSLESIDLSHFSTSNATEMLRMFNGCESLEELDLSTFDTSKASSMRWTFGACFELKKVTVGDKFSFLSSNDDVSAVLPGTSWHSQKDDAWFTPDEITANRNNIADVYTRPAGQNIAEGTWGTCEWVLGSDFTLTIGPGTGVDSLGYWYNGNENWPYADWVKSVRSSGKVVLPANCGHLFADFGNLISFDASGFDSSKATNMEGMFMGCGALEGLDLTSFDTSNVTNMRSMFSGFPGGVSSMKTIDLSSFDTSNVTDMSQMFIACSQLVTVYVGDEWSTENVTNSSGMFMICASLVGGNGTAFDENYKDATYARIDAPGTPGYLTYKAPPAPTPGWHKADGKWYYYRADGTMVASKWEKISGKWYHFDAAGAMEASKWVKDSKGWCYLGSNGAMVTDKWVKDSKGWCYIGSDGYCVTNKWVKDSKGWCYLGSDCRMVFSKWVKDSKGWCYVGSDGYMVYSKWVKDSKGWCYVGTNGYMVSSSWQKISNKWYYFDSAGHMVTGTQVINGKTYKFADNGAWLG